MSLSSRRQIFFLFTGLVSPVLLIIYSCSDNPSPSRSTHHFSISDDSLVKYNKGVFQLEESEINDFVRRYGWKVQTTSSGLRYVIYKRGTGVKAESGKLAKIRYSVKLLNGTLCYSSEESGPKTFLIGKGGVESGLEEGILLLKVGDRAKFILPSHLAFGLLGDQDKIPQNSSLVYDIELVEIK